MAEGQLPDEVKKAIKETFFKELSEDVIIEIFTKSGRTINSMKQPYP